MLAGAACAAAAVEPALVPAAYGAVALLGLVCSGVVWTAGREHSRRRRGWRLFAAAPLFPVLGALLVLVVQPAAPLEVAVLRWVPTVPGYVVAIVGILTLVDRGRLRTGLRGAVELALFVGACLVVVQLLIIGPAGRWSSLQVDQRLILAAAVVATSLTMAAALILLGVVEAHRQGMALTLLAGTVLLTAGRGVSTAALLFTAHGVGVLSQLLVVVGLTLVGLAALTDPGPRTSGRRVRTLPGRSTELGQVLPHVAMVVAVTAIGTAAVLGHQPSVISYVGGTLCIALTAVHRWVTARDEQRLGARLRRNEAYFRSLVASGADAVVILDPELRLTWASPALEQVLGAAAVPLPGRALRDVVHPDDADLLAAAVPSATADDAGEQATGLVVLRMADSAGRWRSLEASVSDLRRDPDVGAVVLHCRDVTERETREAALRGVAYTDPLTGLPNSAGFLRAVRDALTEPGSEPHGDDGATSSTLLLIEMEGLIDVREFAGREVVGGVVAEIGRRLRATVRAEDVVARMGGGGFGILARSTATEADQLADRCLAVVEQPIPTPAGIVDLTASVGLVVLEPDGDVEELLGRGGLAVRAARATGPGSAARYTPALGEAEARRQRLLDDLHGAGSRGELALLYSPIVSLGEQRITGVEALLTWRHPEFGDLEAAEFVPLAERAGLVGDLQRWALEEAMREVAALPSSGTPLRLGIDLAASYVAGGTLVADVENALHRTGLSPERLVLEVPEATVLADDERIALDIASVRLMGVHVALDHFGADNSALASLTRLPVDILKLDRSFLARVDRDAQERALCESVIGIGRALRVDVVAEGVETAAQLATLCSLSCGFAQGFLISRPLPVAGLTALLRDRAGALWPGLVGQR
ncbi:putative bifunctional diguanylate cyclase/phosphodiesterase [Blastococcus sp. SYSU D00669]